MRTILVHLNVEVPETFTGTANELADEIMGSIGVGTDEENTPLLSTFARVTCPMAEEI